MHQNEVSVESHPTANEPRRKVGRKTTGSAAVAVVLALGVLWWFVGTGSPASGRNAAMESPKERADMSSVDGQGIPLNASAGLKTSGERPDSTANEFERQIIGEWEQINKGKRLLTVREDGTATMKVTLDGAWSYVVGERLEFEIEWKIEGKRLLFHMTSGKPEGSMKVIASIYGNDRNHRIDELSEKQMILVDEQDDSRDKWTRIASTETGSKN